MNWLIDIGLVLLVVGTIIIYTYRGFVKSFLGFCKLALSFLVAYLVAPPIGSWISSSFIFESVDDAVYMWLRSLVNNADSNPTVSEFTDQIPDFMLGILENFGVSSDTIVSQFGNSVISEEMFRELSSSISQPISTFIGTAIAFAVVFGVLVIGLTVAVYFLDKLFNLPALKKWNRALGFILGIVCSFIILVVAGSILTFVLNIVGANNPDLGISAEVMQERTIIYKLVSKVNVFVWLLLL